ncbi:MAG: hypothetical protein ACE5JL_15595 [Dehalococcoidia bacterium]
MQVWTDKQVVKIAALAAVLAYLLEEFRVGASRWAGVEMARWRTFGGGGWYRRPARGPMGWVGRGWRR